MKFKISLIAILCLLSAGLITCTKLDVGARSHLTSDNFPKTAQDFIAMAGPVYSSLTAEGNNGNGYWMVSQLSGDECILTAYGGNWYDGGKYMELHLHTFSTMNAQINIVWQWGFNGINTCNRVLKLFEGAAPTSSRDTVLAEIRSVRAYYYFVMMDLFGGIPISTSFGDTAAKPRSSRTDVFNFVESELKAAIPILHTNVDATTYGRPTKWMAYALLAKLYLNAEVYTGSPRYADAESACDTIIQEATARKTFALDADYIAMFRIRNGPQVKDFIYSLPYDPNNTPAGMYMERYWLHQKLQAKYSLPYGPSNCMRTLPAFYSLFNDPHDSRNKIWLAGKQYKYDGSPVTIVTTKKGYDATYSGADANTQIIDTLEFTPDVTFVNQSTFETGNDELGRAKGYRCIKFYPDSTSSNRNQGNDVPVFRYADVLLMKAECILRGAPATLGQDALSLVNQVRSRAGAAPFNTMDLDALLDERGRELCFENWRRNDLIRFGKFEQPWGVKTDANPQKRVFPIPANEIILNPLLTQNPGY